MMLDFMSLSPVAAEDTPSLHALDWSAPSKFKIQLFHDFILMINMITIMMRAMINDHEHEDDDDIKDLLVVFHGRSPVLLLLRKLVLSRPLSLDSCHDQSV